MITAKIPIKLSPLNIWDNKFYIIVFFTEYCGVDLINVTRESPGSIRTLPHYYYALNLDCIWHVNLIGDDETDGFLVLNFVGADFAIHPTDLLTINYRYNDSLDNPVMKLNGQNRPKSFTINSTSLLVHFVSDDVSKMAGFQLEIHYSETFGKTKYL